MKSKKDALDFTIPTNLLVISTQTYENGDSSSKQGWLSISRHKLTHKKIKIFEVKEQKTINPTGNNSTLILIQLLEIEVY